MAIDEKASGGDIEEAWDQMHQRAFARAARTHHRDNFARFHFQIDIAQNLRALVAIRRRRRSTHSRSGCLLENGGSGFALRLFLDVVLRVHEPKNLRGRAERLLEIVVEERKLAHRVVRLKTAMMNATKGSRRELAVSNLVAAQQQQQRNGDRAENIHQRRTDRRRCHRAQVGPEQPLRGLAEARDLPRFHAEGFHDAVAGDGFLKNVLDVGQFVLPARGWCCAPAGQSCLPKR